MFNEVYRKFLFIYLFFFIMNDIPIVVEICILTFNYIYLLLQKKKIICCFTHVNMLIAKDKVY